MEKLNYKWANLILEDDNMDLDVYSGSLAIEPLRKSMSKLSYGEEIDGYSLNYTTRINYD